MPPLPQSVTHTTLPTVSYSLSKVPMPCLRICPLNRLIVSGALEVDMFEVYLLYWYKSTHADQ